MKAAERLQRASLGAAVGLLRAIGPAAASNLGGAVARLIGPALPVSRVADGNLRRAMPELDRAARLRIVRGVWDNLGRTIAELPHLHAIPKDSPAGPGWEMIGEEFLHAQAARGGPAIFVSGHLGNWEMMPPAVATYGMRMHSMYRAPSNRVVDEFLLDLRRRAMGLDADGKLPLLFPKGAAGARTAMKHLIGGGYLGFLVDQKMNDGIEARFFGIPAMTAPALAALALRTRCPVIPGHVERLGPARFRLICEAPLALPDTGDARADQLALTETVNVVLERWIRQRPEGWLWLHRRWPADLSDEHENKRRSG